MPPDPFFAGAGLDRADALRAQPERIAALARDPAARALAWRDGAPAIDAAGRLEWQAIDPGDTPLFLGMDGAEPRFSALPDGGAASDGRAHYQLLGQLAAADAPIFAAALSLANWHRRHGFCSVCGGSTAPVRGGWSRRCGACAAEHFPRADPVVSDESDAVVWFPVDDLPRDFDAAMTLGTILTRAGQDTEASAGRSRKGRKIRHHGVTAL